eukprot:7129841-Prymnesium_polylepis.1
MERGGGVASRRRRSGAVRTQAKVKRVSLMALIAITFGTGPGIFILLRIFVMEAHARRAQGSRASQNDSSSRNDLNPQSRDAGRVYRPKSARRNYRRSEKSHRASILAKSPSRVQCTSYSRLRSTL